MPDLQAFLAGGGEMGALIRAHDWAATPLGPIEGWPQSLRSALSICLRSGGATAITWGKDNIFLYNDAWGAMLGDRHRWALGRPAHEVMADIWSMLKDQIESVTEGGESINMVDRLLVRTHEGSSFDSYWTYSLLPVASEDGTIGGILAQARETTASVLRARRDALMLRLAERLRLLKDPREVLETAVALVGEELDAGRIGYAEVDEEAGLLATLCCATRDGMADISSTVPIPTFGAKVDADLRGGRVIRIDNSWTDPRVTPGKARQKYVELGAAAALVVPVISGERYVAMMFAHHHQPKSWTDHHALLLRAATEHVWREVSRARAEAALRHSEERYRRIFEQANDIIFTAGLDQIITDCNPAGAAALGLDRDQVVGHSIAEFVSKKDFAQTTRMLRQKLEHGGTTHHDISVQARSGQVMEWEINSSLATDPAGKPIGLHAIARDVTERKRGEQRQRLLVNELNHRVKNTLALVQGLALQSFKEGRDPDEARTAFQQRLAALATAHDLLTRESWEGATLGTLVREAVGHYNAAEEVISIGGPNLILGPKASVSLVMALHELATNAAKYGALSISSGRIRIAWDLEDGGDRLHFEWLESNGPAVHPPERRGFGLRMIERALSADLAGTVRIGFEPDGLICRIDANLVEAAPRPRLT